MPPIPASITPTKPTTPLPEPKSPKSLPGDTLPKSKSSKRIKLIISLTLITIVIFLIGIISSITRDNILRFRPTGNNRILPTLTPIPTYPPQAPVYGQPSEYSNDPQILQLEGTAKNFLNQLTVDDLSEPEIQPPVLEKNINFK